MAMYWFSSHREVGMGKRKFSKFYVWCAASATGYIYPAGRTPVPTGRTAGCEWPAAERFPSGLVARAEALSRFAVGNKAGAHLA